MLKSFLIILIGLLVGTGIGYSLVLYSPLSAVSLQSNSSKDSSDNSPVTQNKTPGDKIVVGFLPYWLVSKAQDDYSDYITQLSYFSLTIGDEGRIVKLTTPIETDPGWNNLQSGNMDETFAQAKKKGVQLSLTVFKLDNEAIETLMQKPVEHAQNLVADVIPIMRKYGFTDLNLDIESTSDASEDARKNFTIFAREVKTGLDKANIGTLTVDISASDLIKKKLINPEEVGKIADYMLIMGYDYHYIGSMVTGPVSPLAGAESVSEYDIQTAVAKAEAVMPKEKIILGVPVYGYEWESLGTVDRAAVIPGTGLTASTSRVERLLQSCDECKVQRDPVGDEAYVVYEDEETGTTHQIFYPDQQAMQGKVNFSEERQLGGMAIWALGYESSDLMEPLKEYIK